MHAITLPSFAHHVGQSAVLSYHIGALYGELLLHSSCMPFHAKSISFERLWSLSYTRSHYLPSSISLSNTGLYIYLPSGITIDSDWSVLWWCHRDFAETTPSKSIHHREVSFIAPPSRFLLHDWHTAPSSSLCCQVRPARDLLSFRSDTAGIALSFTPAAIHSSCSALQAKEFLLPSTCVNSSI